MANKVLDYNETITLAATGTTFGGTDIVSTTGASRHICPGKVFLITANCSDLTNSVTYTLELRDKNNKTLFSRSGLAENAFSSIHEDDNGDRLDHPIYEGCDIYITLSGVAGGSGGTIDITIYYIR